MSSSSVPVSLFPVEPSAEIRRYREGKIKLRVSMWHYSALRAKPAGTATEGGIGGNNTRKLTHLGRAFLQFADPNHRFFLPSPYPTPRPHNLAWYALESGRPIHIACIPLETSSVPTFVVVRLPSWRTPRTSTSKRWYWSTSNPLEHRHGDWSTWLPATVVLARRNAGGSRRPDKPENAKRTDTETLNRNW